MNQPMSNAMFALVGILLATSSAQAQHLWWNLEGQRDGKCLYGEITVLATNPGIYFCGANWHPGEPAGGYCGIQHNRPREKRTIFSIWDTKPNLHPSVTEADGKTVHNRFGGEGEGGHTHMLWDWNVGEKFQFFVQKQPGRQEGTTEARYYIFDPKGKAWLHSATISSPNGDAKSVTTLGGGINSFLENFTGREKQTPKLALYRLWLGPSIDQMKCLTRAGGDGVWGQLQDAYFLAEGEPAQLDALYQKLEKDYGRPTPGIKGKYLKPISNQPLPPGLADALKHLPRAAKVEGK